MLISFSDVCFGFAGKPLRNNINFVLSEGDKVGLIGPNGEGKTTLIRLIVGELDAENGEIFRKNGIRIGYLAQTGGFNFNGTVYEEMRSIFLEDLQNIDGLHLLEKQISTATEGTDEYKILSSKYDALNKKIYARDAYNVDVKIKTVLNGMGFEKFYDHEIATMSGGEKTRLKLCRLLLEEPDLLILDEPTNHLDIKTLFWLEEYLSTYKGALLTVSHDRFFLDKTVQSVFELENKTLCTFKGNYTKYKVLKAEKVARLLKEYNKQQEEIAHLQDYVARNLVRATTAKSAQSRVKQLERMDVIEKPTLPPTPPRFRFTYTEKPYEKVLDVNGLNLEIGGKTLLSNVSFTVMRGEKCAVVGENGTGKSTLIKELIKNKNESVRFGRFVKTAYYDQENQNLNPHNTVLAELWERHSLWSQTQVRSLLASVKLDESDVDKQVSFLSGGERAKLALAVFETENGNLLVLDEPTNHLDLPAREALETALKEFDGTILFVSHDRYFIESIANKVIELEKGSLNVFVGDYENYVTEKNLINAKQTELEREKKLAQAESEKQQKQKEGYLSKEEKAIKTKTRLRIKQIEDEITKLETENDTLTAEISDPTIASDYTKLSQKCKRMEEIKTALDKLYEEYETLI